MVEADRQERHVEARRVGGDVLVVRAVGSTILFEGGFGEAPTLAYDAETGAWREPTSREAAAWTGADMNGLGLDDLPTALTGD